jgi:hypothetical protein
MSRQLLVWSAVLSIGIAASSASAAPVFFFDLGTSYLSQANIPAGFYAGGAPTALENFEDGTLDFGITASTGSVLGPSGNTDSVDGDDGAIDGSGTGGHSWFSGNGAAGVTFTFSGALPTAAGIVWTDGSGDTTFEAFGAGMVSLGTITESIADGSFTGTTAEDHFFGVQDFAGILAVKLSNGGGGIEVDHVQFGAAPGASDGSVIPEPSTLVISSIAFGLYGVIGLRKRMKQLASSVTGP